MSMATVALELQPCCGARSGIGTYTYELTRRLRSDTEVTFCGNLFGKSALETFPFPVRQFPSIPYGVYRRIWHILPLRYNSFFPEADLNIFFDYIVPPRVAGKVITTVHDLSFIRYPETMSKRNLKRIQKDIVYSLERSERILTVSQFSKEELTSCMGVDSDKISVIYNAPSISPETADAQIIKNKYHITFPYILYVGTIEPRKNITRLLYAFDKLKQETGLPHHLVLAGGNGWNNKEIYKAADTLSSKSFIHFIGYISGPEKNALYQQAQAFVFPSLYEGFGIPPLEAMHFGCPVICSKAASLPEIIGEAGEYVDPMDTASIAQGLWNVLFQERVANQLRELGRRQAAQFCWDSSSQELEKICKDVLKNR